MAEAVNVAEAKAKLSSLLDRAAGGEEIVIARAGKPLARLVPLETAPKRQFGAMRDRWPAIPDDLFLKPATEEELRWAEGYFQDSAGLYRVAKATREPARRKSQSKKRPSRR